MTFSMDECSFDNKETMDRLKGLLTRVENLYDSRDKNLFIEIEKPILAEVSEKDNAYLEFYVTECQEFHKYKELREDPRNAYKGNGMGFIIHDQSLGNYDETEYPLINGSRLTKERDI